MLGVVNLVPRLRVSHQQRRHHLDGRTTLQGDLQLQPPVLTALRRSAVASKLERACMQAVQRSAEGCSAGAGAHRVLLHLVHLGQASRGRVVVDDRHISDTMQLASQHACYIELLFRTTDLAVACEVH